MITKYIHNAVAKKTKVCAELISAFGNTYHGVNVESAIVTGKPDDQISLFEELALMREAASQHVQIYDAVLQQGKQESILAAAELMALSLSRVADVCKSAATIHNVQKDKFSIHDLSFIIEQFIRISYDVIKDEEIANKLALRLRSELQLTQAVGTSITTDQMVQQMDQETAPAQ